MNVIEFAEKRLQDGISLYALRQMAGAVLQGREALTMTTPRNFGTGGQKHERVRSADGDAVKR